MSARCATDLGQRAVVARAFDEIGIALLGQLGAGIVRDLLHDLAVAARNQHIGHRRHQLLAPRQREQMRLPFGARDIDEILLFEPRRLRQDRRRDGDILVIGKPAQDRDRRIGDRREPLRQFRLGPAFDFLDQAGEDVVEQTDMVFVEMSRAFEEQRGDLPQDLAMLLRAAMQQRRLQFWNQRGIGGHGTRNAKTPVNTGLFRI